MFPLRLRGFQPGYQRRLQGVVAPECARTRPTACLRRTGVSKAIRVPAETPFFPGSEGLEEGVVKLYSLVVEQAGDDPLEVGLLFPHLPDSDLRGITLGESIDAGRNRGECDRG